MLIKKKKIKIILQNNFKNKIKIKIQKINKLHKLHKLNKLNKLHKI